MTRGLDDSPIEQRQGTNLLVSQAQLVTGRAVIAAVVDSEGLRLRPTGRGFSASLLSQIHVDSAVVADSFFLAFSNQDVTVRRGNRETRVAYGAPYNEAGVSFAVTSKPTVNNATLVLSPREATIDGVRAKVKVTPRDETDVADIAYDDEVPEIAQRVVNVLVKTFQNMDVEQSQAESRRRRIFLTEQLREIDVQLARSEQALTSFRSRHESFSSRDKIQAQQTALMSLDIRQGELSADRRTYSTLLQRLQDSLAQGRGDELRTLIAAPEINSNSVISQLYQQLAQYQHTRDSLTTGPWRSAPGNPDVARLDQLISGSEQRLLGAVRGQITNIDARLEALGALRSRNAATIGTLPRAESDEERLVRQVESNRSLADRLRDEYQKARMAEAVEAGQVAIVDLAALPYRPVPRLRTLRLLLGVVLGLALGSVLALWRDSTNSRVRRRVDLEDEMRIPVLAVIPRITTQADDQHSLRRLSARLVPRNSSAVRRGTDELIQGPRATTATAFMSPAGSEAFRLLRSSLKWTQRDPSAKTLAISSALAEEGKTTTSANLAVVCALEGKRVLLVDCDMRRPRLHQVFRVPLSPGVAQVLRAGLDPATAVRDTPFQGLSFLPAGRDTDAIADFIGSDRMRALLAVLSEHFDVIIIDTPPVLGVADAVALGPLVDGVVMVVGAGKTDRQAVEQALSQLASAGARVIGAVLNDSRGEVERYGNDDYYTYSSSYSQSKSTA
jgi:tyrosine-protein kinase Etk/Wzc